MMKVKLLRNLKQSEFEKNINNFISDKHVIDIKYQFIFTEKVGFVYSGVIMYEETD